MYCFNTCRYSVSHSFKYLFDQISPKFLIKILLQCLQNPRAKLSEIARTRSKLCYYTIIAPNNQQQNFKFYLFYRYCVKATTTSSVELNKSNQYFNRSTLVYTKLSQREHHQLCYHIQWHPGQHYKCLNKFHIDRTRPSHHLHH